MARKQVSTINIPPTTMIDASKLNPAVYNPRRISPSKLTSLKQSIRTKGFLQAIVVQKKGLIIVGGHQRLRAVKELFAEQSKPLPELPCIVLDLTDREAKQLNISLNRVEGEFDSKMLGEVLLDLNKESTLSDVEMTLMGMDQGEVEKFIAIAQPTIDLSGEESMTSFAQSVTLSLEFDDVRMRDSVKKAMTERGKIEKKKSGEVAFDMFGLKKTW